MQMRRHPAAKRPGTAGAGRGSGVAVATLLPWEPGPSRSDTGGRGFLLPRQRATAPLPGPLLGVAMANVSRTCRGGVGGRGCGGAVTGRLPR